MPAHKDFSSITLLFQDRGGGLEFEDPNRPGEFVSAEPTPGALTLNVGDMLERLSSGIFRSATHRVTLPNHGEKLDATSNKITPARYSIPYFVVPDENEMVRCFTSCILDERPLKFEPVTVTEYAADITRYQYKNKK
ncbi:MAG: hypothetical protein MMC33_002395 [Icmadophila ericetorum]|nr:hypothetical protein [Icmadophila ericetorum]